MLKFGFPLSGDQRGLGVIEVLIAIAVSSLILGALTTATLRLTRFQDGNNAQIEANRNSENVMGYISADVRRAQWAYGPDGVTFLDTYGTGQLPVTFKWTDYANGGAIRSVLYELDSGRLRRTYDGGAPALVGRGIGSLNFLQNATTGKVTVTLIPTNAASQPENARQFDLDPRPKQP